MNCSINYTFVLLYRHLIISKQYLLYSLKICSLKRNASGPCMSSLFTCSIEPNYKMMLCIPLLRYVPDIPYISKYYLDIHFHFHCNKKNSF